MSEADSDRWNFRVFLGQGVLKSTADEMSSPRLVLPYLYTSFGGPPWLAGMLMPIATFGKLAAQLIAAPIIDRARIAKGYLAATTLVSALTLAVISVLSDTLPPAGMVVMFPLAAAVVGLASGFGSLTFQDILGRVLSQPFRGSLLFTTTAAAGVVTIVVATLTNVMASENHTAEAVNILLLWVGIALFIFASVAVLAIREDPKPASAPATSGRGHFNRYVAELTGGLSLVSHLAWFRRYLVALFFFLSIELVVPFVAIHVHTFHADTEIGLGMFMATSSVGMIVAGIVWPGVIRKSIRLQLSAASLMAALALAIAIIINVVPWLQAPVAHAIIFGLLTIAGLGIVNGRTVYLVSAATDAERPFCVAVTNLLAGVLGLVVALIIGSISHVHSIVLGLAFLLCMNIGAAICARFLPEVPHRDGER